MRAFSLAVLLLAAACSAAALERRSEPQAPSAEPAEWHAAAVGADDAGTWQEAEAAVAHDSAAEVASTSAESSKLPAGDCAIMNYALALEHLERTFYEESLGWLSAEDFYKANIPNAQKVYLNFVHISQHERQHVKTLQRVITTFCGTPLPPCKYNFGVSDVKSFLAVARLFEKIGVSAYDGALALIATGDIQTAAGTIASVESRHASFLNMAASDGDPFPHDFDTPLAKSAVVSMAASVIESCPFDIPSTLGVPFKSLTLVSPSGIRVGRNIQLEYEGSSSGGHFCSFLFSDKSVTVPLDPGCGCKVPKGCRGDIFVAVISRNEQLTLKNTESLIVAGPIVVNVDTAEDDSCKDFVHGSPRSYSSHTGWSSYEEQHSYEKSHSYEKPNSHEKPYSYEKPYSSWESPGYHSSSGYEGDVQSVQHVTTQESSANGQWPDSAVAATQDDTTETVVPEDESTPSSSQTPSGHPSSAVTAVASAESAAADHASDGEVANEDNAADGEIADEDPAAGGGEAAADPEVDEAAAAGPIVVGPSPSKSSSADPSAATESPSAAADAPSEIPIPADGENSTDGAADGAQ